MKLILDTDPGADDAIAILWALGLDLQYRAEVMAVTTVEGNLKRRATFDNACSLLAYCLRDDIRVARAAPHSGANATHIHGNDGLAGLSSMLPKHNKLFDAAAESPRQMVRLINRHPGEITIIAIGPLTNLAAAEKLQPGILAKTNRIIVLGGAFQRGNVTAHAEFNAHYNPVAFHEVINSTANVVLIPLDITRQLDLKPEHLESAGLSDDNLRVVKFFKRLCTAMAVALSQNEYERLFFVHDACAMAYAVYPELFEAVDANVDIEVRGDQKFLGRTSIQPTGAPNVTILRRIDADSVRESMLADLLSFAEKLA